MIRGLRQHGCDFVGFPPQVISRSACRTVFGQRLRASSSARETTGSASASRSRRDKASPSSQRAFVASKPLAGSLSASRSATRAAPSASSGLPNIRLMARAICCSASGACARVGAATSIAAPSMIARVRIVPRSAESALPSYRNVAEPAVTPTNYGGRRARLHHSASAASGSHTGRPLRNEDTQARRGARTASPR